MKFIDLAGNEEQAKTFFFPSLVRMCERQVKEGEHEPMSWNDARDLVNRGHVIGCHGFSHKALSPELGEGEMFHEIVESKRIMENRLGVPVSAFCWPLGTPSSYSKAAYNMIRQHYDFAFTTFASPLFQNSNQYAIDRSNVEAHMSLARVKCAVQGVTEVYFVNRRRRFEFLIR